MVVGVFVLLMRASLLKEHGIWTPNFSLAGEGQLSAALTGFVCLPFVHNLFGLVCPSRSAVPSVDLRFFPGKADPGKQHQLCLALLISCFARLGCSAQNLLFG